MHYESVSSKNMGGSNENTYFAVKKFLGDYGAKLQHSCEKFSEGNFRDN